MHLIELYETGETKHTIMGNDSLYEYKVQHFIPHDCWFGSYVNPGGQYSFVGCTIFPGFDEKDFELANEHTLVSKFPRHKNIIKSFFNEN